jgi:hypothetical protein
MWCGGVVAAQDILYKEERDRVGLQFGTEREAKRVEARGQRCTAGGGGGNWQLVTCGNWGWLAGEAPRGVALGAGPTQHPPQSLRLQRDTCFGLGRQVRGLGLGRRGADP